MNWSLIVLIAVLALSLWTIAVLLLCVWLVRLFTRSAVKVALRTSAPSRRHGAPGLAESSAAYREEIDQRVGRSRSMEALIDRVDEAMARRTRKRAPRFVVEINGRPFELKPGKNTIFLADNAPASGSKASPVKDEAFERVMEENTADLGPRSGSEIGAVATGPGGMEGPPGSVFEPLTGQFLELGRNKPLRDFTSLGAIHLSMLRALERRPGERSPKTRKPRLSIAATRGLLARNQRFARARYLQLLRKPYHATP